MMTSNLANDYLTETITLRRTLEQGFIHLAERLWTIYTQMHWKVQYESYEDFLAEADISKATDSRLRAVYKTFVLDYKQPIEKLAPIGWDKLYRISQVEGKAQALALLDKAGHLRREEFEEQLAAEKHGEHEHESEEEITMGKCKVVSGCLGLVEKYEQSH